MEKKEKSEGKIVKAFMVRKMDMESIHITIEHTIRRDFHTTVEEYYEKIERLASDIEDILEDHKSVDIDVVEANVKFFDACSVCDNVWSTSIYEEGGERCNWCNCCVLGGETEKEDD